MRAVIIKGIGGFYYAEAEDGQLYECKARGIFRLNGITPLAGDRIEMGISADGQATVDEILPRLNSFERPPCANVEVVVLVVAGRDPLPSFDVIDRFMIAAERKNAGIVLALTKLDIAEPFVIEEIEKRYSPCYRIFRLNGLNGEGADELAEALKGKQVTLAGASGVGKSTLTNLLTGRRISETGSISRKTERGRNTTRHTELFKADGFWLFDTPGFTSFDLPEDVRPEELSGYFHEFAPYLGKCRFSDCTHISEPECAVREAVREGKINKDRYRSFKNIYLELKERNIYG